MTLFPAVVALVTMRQALCLLRPEVCGVVEQ